MNAPTSPVILDSGFQTLLEFILTNPGLRSEEIRRQIDGEPQLARKALARLRETGEAIIKGQARGARYFGV